jgi:micrococcal nuclease
MYKYNVKGVKKVVDGDTVDLEIDLGFNVVILQRIRLKGINAPETRTLDLSEKEKGIVAKEWLQKQLEDSNAKWVIETTKEDKYGRMLGVLYRVGEFVSLNESMILGGYAKPYLP